MDGEDQGVLIMASYTWDFGSDAENLKFTVVYDSVTKEFTVTVLTGSLNVNALYWGDGDAESGEGTMSGFDAKKDSSLNMNGTGEVWDGGLKISNAGLGKTPPDSYISADSAHNSFSIDAGSFDPAKFGTVGVRATSTTSEGGSIKWIDDAPTPNTGNPPANDFPVVDNISFVDFYFDKDKDGAADAIVRVNYSGPDSGPNMDVDNWDQAFLAALKQMNIDNDAAVDDLAGYSYMGASIHVGGPGGGTLEYYAQDGTPSPNTAPSPGLVQTTNPSGNVNFGFGGEFSDVPHAVLSTSDAVTFTVSETWSGDF